jgi:hypothetical protein
VHILACRSQFPSSFRNQSGSRLPTSAECRQRSQGLAGSAEVSFAAERLLAHSGEQLPGRGAIGGPWPWERCWRTCFLS